MDKIIIRLDKFLSNAGIISRRGVKQFLKVNTVEVNGKRETESGIRVDSRSDSITVNGEKVQQQSFVYYMLNKPVGIISTTSDEFGRENVTSLIHTTKRIYPVGRLDKDSHGFVLLTNDGELTHQLIHPRYHVPKVYRITVNGIPSSHQIELLQKGIILEDGITLPTKVLIIKKGNLQTIFEITLYEGRNRQIRRMCDEVGLILSDLKRISFGPLTLSNLKQGGYRELSLQEIELLRNAAVKKYDMLNTKR